jgi:small subunit ribosomal protein S20
MRAKGLDNALEAVYISALRKLNGRQDNLREIMPQHKSCEKRMRTSNEARVRNRRNRSRCRIAEKRVMEAKDRGAALEELRKAFSLLDHMADKGLVHRNTAARQKAKLARHVGALQG